MAVFERAKGSLRFYSKSSDAFPTRAGGIPTGSILVHYDTGDRFIYDSGGDDWHAFIGDEDIVTVLEEIRDADQSLLLILEDLSERITLAIG